MQWIKNAPLNHGSGLERLNWMLELSCELYPTLFGSEWTINDKLIDIIYI